MTNYLLSKFRLLTVVLMTAVICTSLTGQTVAEQTIEKSRLMNQSVEFIDEIPEPSGPPPVPTDDERFVFFRNFDPAFQQSAYYKYFEESEYADGFLRTDFSDDFFSSHEITDYEIAVFPLGNMALNAATNGGIKVIDKINEMLDNGGKVIITGRVALLAAHGTSGADPAVADLLENKLGVEYIGWQPTCDTSGTTITFRQFIAKGAPGDPVSIGFAKNCNVISNSVPPLAYYYNADVFKKKNDVKFNAVDHFTLGSEPNNTDTLVGIRSELENGAKAVFWSIGYEVICHDHDRSMNLMGAMRWLLRAKPGEGPNIEFLESQVNYGTVAIEDTSYKNVVVRNSGNSMLTIDEIYLEEFLWEGIFEIDESTLPALPVQLEPDELFSVKVAFMPMENRTYNEYLDFISDANNANSEGMISVELRGTGGVGIAPLLSVSDSTLDFGEIEPLKQVDKDITFKNVGTQEFFINYMAIEEDEMNVFRFQEGSSVPATLEPQETRKVKIRFVPQEHDTEYTANLKVLSNSENLPQMDIPLRGSGSSAGAVYDWGRSPSGRLSLSIAPNPVGQNANISFSVGSQLPVHAELLLFDEAGNLVAGLIDRAVTPGQTDISFESGSLATGQYYMVLRAMGETAVMPLTVSK